MKEELVFDIGFALGWIAPTSTWCYICPQTEQLSEVEMHLSEYQAETMLLGQQTVGVFLCHCGFTHLYDALYIPMFLKTHPGLDETLPMKEILASRVWRQ